MQEQTGLQACQERSPVLSTLLLSRGLAVLRAPGAEVSAGSAGGQWRGIGHNVAQGEGALEVVGARE